MSKKKKKKTFSGTPSLFLRIRLRDSILFLTSIHSHAQLTAAFQQNVSSTIRSDLQSLTPEMDLSSFHDDAFTENKWKHFCATVQLIIITLLLLHLGLETIRQSLKHQQNMISGPTPYLKNIFSDLHFFFILRDRKCNLSDFKQQSIQDSEDWEPVESEQPFSIQTSHEKWDPIYDCSFKILRKDLKQWYTIKISILDMTEN